MKSSIRFAVTIAGVLSMAWWLFGFTTHREGPFETRMVRRLGRVTRIDMSLSNSKYRERIVFSWLEPYQQGDPITSCASILPEVWQDRNGDRTWDTWLYRVGPDASGECSVEYRVDLTDDGNPDWRFTSARGEHAVAWNRILARRGF